MHTYWTSMFWPIDSCQNRVPAGHYHLTVSTVRCRPNEVKYLMKLSADKLLVFKSSRAQVQFFVNSYEICCVYVPHNYSVDFKLTSDAKIQPAVAGEEDSCSWLFSPWSRVGQALRPIFTLWLVKIWQVSSWGKFMQLLDPCLLWQLKLTEFRVNLWCF